MSRAARLPAGPPTHAWIQTLAFSRNPLEYIRSCARRYGDTYTMQLAGMGDIVLFSAPDAVREVFGLPSAGLRNGNDVVRYLLHDRSLIFMEGEEHISVRRMLTPPFHGAQLTSSADRFMDAIGRASGDWTDGGSVNLHRAFQHATFDALFTAIFGDTPIADFERLRAELLAYVNGQLTNGMFFASLAFGPRLSATLRTKVARTKGALAAHRPAPRGGFLAARAANLANVETLLDRVVRDRKTSGVDGNDALGRMLASGRLSEEDMISQILTLLVAGHDTTSLALSWMTIQVLEHPEVLARLLDELRAARTPEGLDGAVVAELPYLGAVVTESLRLTPIAAFAPRRMDRDVEIGGVAVPAGTYLAANIIAAHARRETWGDPERFRPERFLDVEPSPWSFIPFGGGIRKCLGAAFAAAEMRFMFARLISDWDLAMDPGYSARPAVHGFLIGPAKPLRTLVRRRSWN